MTKTYRSVFISDLHLGSRDAKAERLLEFLNGVECDHLYLVGDVMDFWKLDRKSYFPTSHRRVIRRIVEMAEMGTQVTYIVGNHDEALRPFLPFQMGRIQVCNEARHVTLTGASYLVIHGDQYDDVMEHARWLAYIGDVAYTVLLSFNGVINRLRGKFGLPYWSISAWAKRRIKSAVNFVSEFEARVAAEAADRGIQGVICGHIHTAETRMIGTSYPTHYVNTGDWVESCTAVVEHMTGELELIRPGVDAASGAASAAIYAFPRAA